VKILVADDSKVNLMLITLVLKEQGHTVVIVTTGEQAIHEFQRERPDLVILDVVMEGMDGFECAKQIRAISTDDWIPIIFLSNSIDDVSVAKGIDAGGDDYLAKPFSKTTLIAKIKAMQRISDMRQQLYKLTKELSVMSATDALTGIYNRFQFDISIFERLNMADRFHRQMALLFVDLDNFKLVNDSFGHHIGDLLIKEIASRLKTCLRKEDFIARIGGDEFAIILSDIEKPEVAGDIAQKLLDVLTPDYYLSDKIVRISASIGIACYPSLGVTRESIVKSADIAMYHAKELGRNSYQYYTGEIEQKYKQHLHLEQTLNFALEKNQLYLKYQPIFNLQSRKVVGLETLICWEHPEYGSISPAIFIPLAEEIGLIGVIGDWVIKTACEHAMTWSLNQIPDFKLAINISSYQFVQEDFYQQVMNIISDTGVSPKLLELEITETTAMNYAVVVSEGLIKKFDDYGISIAIDDFGTGYSSLTRLKHLAISTLKIDQIFIKDALIDYKSRTIVKTLIEMSKELRLNVIAEGIESQEQLDFLLLCGCTQGQGYFLGMPLIADHIERYINETNKNKD
jgi:diguanylate cyclase (GGDEF)-like protein